jgi:hypothetical protein
MSRLNLLLSTLIVFTISPLSLCAQGFIHPGIDQTAAELRYMKEQVLAGREPWKSAFDRLLAETDLEQEIKPFAHVIRGAYGRPNIGGGELSKSADLAYDCAILWWITEDQKFADRAMEILRDWAAMLRSFDYNDAKLLAGWTGYQFCNAAEILRYSRAGWPPAEIEAFSEMLLTVYYPLIRDYFPQANGNWDGAIIHTLMAIGVFTDNHLIFDDALDHFLYAPVNGSIFKYIYPSGQCQESIRDQAHVQLGLGEFAGAARIARTQGIDLFSPADYRIALGYEYTARFLLGEQPQCYGILSERKREEIRDIYEFVLQYHQARGVNMPYTAKLAASLREGAGRTLLTAFPVPAAETVKENIDLKPGKIAYPAGALAAAKVNTAEYLIVTPGESLQAALDQAAKEGGKVLAKAGVHVLPHSLLMPSNVTLSGEGEQTILFLDPSSGDRDAIKNADPDMHDVSLAKLVIEGYTKTEYSTDPNSHRSFKNGYHRGGIVFLSDGESTLKNIKLDHITVKNCTTNGVLISGADNVEITGCNFEENGASVVPGPKQLHNLSLTHCSQVLVQDSRLDTSPNGSGVNIFAGENVQISGCEIARNGWAGIRVAESTDLQLKNNLLEANDGGGIMLEDLFQGCQKVLISGNLIRFNAGKGIVAEGVNDLSIVDNELIGNRE